MAEFDMGKFQKAMDITTGMGSLLMGTINRGKQLSDLPENEHQSTIDALNASSYNNSSYDDLINQFSSENFAKTDFRQRDLLGLTKGQAAGKIALNALIGGAEGAKFGTSIAPGWGTLIGAVVGTVADSLGSGIGWAVGKGNAQRLSQKLNFEGSAANQQLFAKAQNNAMNIGKDMKNQSLLNMGAYNSVAFGGPLNPMPSDFTNGVRVIEEGGSHEQNPFGGVPQGIAQDGIPNLVEEGEVIYNDYVYSMRLKVPQADKEMLGLKKDKDYTYAEAAEYIQRESEERPNDPLSKKNLDEMMGRLQGSQEDVKVKKEARDLKKAVNSMTPDELAMFNQQLQFPQQMQPMMAMQSMQPMQPTQSEVPMFAKGGILGHKHAGPWSYSFLQTDYPTLAEAGIDARNLNLPPVTVTGTTVPDVGTAFENGYFDDLAQRWKQAGINAGLQVTPATAPKAQAPTYTNYIEGEATDAGKKAAPKATGVGNEGEADTTSTTPSYAQFLRSMPIWFNAMGALSTLFDKPNYSNAKRVEDELYRIPNVSAGHVGQRMFYNPTDINYLATVAANQGLGARRALVEHGAGNPAGIQQAIIANNYAGQTALGQNILNAQLNNRNNLLQALAFNRETDSANIGNDLQAAMANQRIAAMRPEMLYRTALMRDRELATVQDNRSRQWTNLGQQLGNLGKDMVAREQVAANVDSGVYGTLSDAERQMALNLLLSRLSPRPTTSAKAGGKLNTKKGGKHA